MTPEKAAKHYTIKCLDEKQEKVTHCVCSLQRAFGAGVQRQSCRRAPAAWRCVPVNQQP